MEPALKKLGITSGEAIIDLSMRKAIKVVPITVLVHNRRLRWLSCENYAARMHLSAREGHKMIYLSRLLDALLLGV